MKTTENNLSKVEFYEYLGSGNQRPLFSIYMATGATREYYAGRSDLIQLGESSQAVYFAKLAADTQGDTLQIESEDIKSRFSLVTQDWSD